MSMRFDIAVFAVNESRTLRSCVEALDHACEGQTARISVLLNGTIDNSIEVLKSLELSHAALEVYLFPEASKANAINQFLYSIRCRSAEIHFFVDAYVTVTTGALRAMADAMATDKHAYMASGVPLTGRTGKAIGGMVQQGQSVLMGNLYAMRPEFASRLVAEGLRLPHGIYWSDPLLGAMAKHDLSHTNRPWDDGRVIGVLGGTYTFRPLSPFRWSDIKRQYNRRIRVALGRIQNEMVKEIVYQDGFSALPEDSRELVIRWLLKHPLSWHSYLRGDFFTNRAVRQNLASPAAQASAPQLVLQRAPLRG